MAETHLTDIKIDPISPASGTGSDESRPTDGAESNENNQLQGKKISEDGKAETQESAISNKDEVSLPLWLSKIMEETEETKNDQPEEPDIPMAPDNLKKTNKECYSPLVVSIGPYHYSNRKEKLKQVEKLKVPMTRQFVQGSKKTTEEFYLNVKKELQNAKGCYSKSLPEHLNDDDEEFTKMMFIDGCFILQFMHCLEDGYENLEMSDQQIVHVKRDLLLLENQLPFAVLDSLRKQRYKNRHTSDRIINHFLSLHIRWSSRPIRKWVWIAFAALGLVMIPILIPLIPLAITFYCITYHCFPVEFVSILLSFLDDNYTEPLELSPPPPRKKNSARRDDKEPVHLLELLYYKSMYHCSKCNDKKAKKGSRGHCLYYSAKKLREVGIRFRPSWTGAITDVKFKSSIFSGTLKVPPIIINESTKSLLLNLVAYETSAALDQPWVSSYIYFMDSLIDNAEDVEELRSNGILINYLGADQKVADLFNDMGSSMEHDTGAYNDVKMAINKQCESIMKRWVSEWKRTYFRSPWTFITVLAASFGLALTATQTYYTRYPAN